MKHYFVLLSVFFSSCAHHVLIDRPVDETAPVEMREAYFDAHQLNPATTNDFILRRRFGAQKPTVVQKYAEMNNGTPIHHVEDLMPLVKSDSATAKSIEMALAQRHNAEIFIYSGSAVGVVGVLAGATLLAVEVGAIPGTERTPTRDAPPIYAIAGFTTAAVSAIVGGGLVVWGTFSRDIEEDETTKAFRSFNDDLRVRLAMTKKVPAEKPAEATEPTEPESKPVSEEQPVTPSETAKEANKTPCTEGKDADCSSIPAKE